MEQTDDNEDFKKELQALAQGIKLTDDAEKAVRLLLKYTERVGNYPKNFTSEQVELIQDLIVLLNYRKTQRKRFKKIEYIHNRNLLIPRAEAIAYKRLREEAFSPSPEEYNNKFNLYFHTAMSKLAFEVLGVTDSNTREESGTSIESR